MTVVDAFAAQGRDTLGASAAFASFDEAEDAVQETYLRAWRGREGFDGSTLLRAWLYRIATNVCLDLLRSRARRGTS